MKKAILLILAAVLAIVAVAGLKYYRTYYKPNSVDNKADIYVYENGSYEAFLDSLFSNGVVADTKSFTTAAQKLGLAPVLKAGHYNVKGGLTNKEIIRIFANGYQTPIKLQVNGYIRTAENMASYLGHRLQADSAAFIAALTDRELMESLGFKKETYLSVFIPDTYEVWWTISPEDLIKRMKKEYDAFWNESRKARAKEIGLSQDQVMTLASIVIEETKYEPEMPTVAGVYINRLNKGMLLQADPTVLFALNTPGVTRVLNKHLETDSPYNTYKYPGLPPGPITIAPKSAIEAVLNYQHHNYLYFCAKDTFDGRHNFAVSYSDHLKNARAYQRALSARTSSRAAL
ncbi:MAG: endolytic transglycosylase MltG [Bacteroidales bacterium]|nr:endolytic transglycosylase MltG [Bacteroidales bacterium]